MDLRVVDAGDDDQHQRREKRKEAKREKGKTGEASKQQQPHQQQRQKTTTTTCGIKTEQVQTNTAKGRIFHKDPMKEKVGKMVGDPTKKFVSAMQTHLTMWHEF